MEIIPLLWWQYCWKLHCANSNSRLIPTAPSVHLYWGESPLTWFTWTLNLTASNTVFSLIWGILGQVGSKFPAQQLWGCEHQRSSRRGTAKPSVKGAGRAHRRGRWSTGRELGVRISSLGMKSSSQADGAELVYEPGLWDPLSPSGWLWGEVLPADTQEGPGCSSPISSLHTDQGAVQPGGVSWRGNTKLWNAALSSWLMLMTKKIRVSWANPAKFLQSLQRLAYTKITLQPSHHLLLPYRGCKLN